MMKIMSIEKYLYIEIFKSEVINDIFICIVPLVTSLCIIFHQMKIEKGQVVVENYTFEPSFSLKLHFDP